jgi:hypothetical protein
MLREIRDEHSIVQIRTVTQTIIQLHLKSFAADKQTVRMFKLAMVALLRIHKLYADVIFFR